MKHFISILLIILAVFVVHGCAAPDKPTIGLYIAIKRGDIDQIERHIYWGTDINQVNIDGQTPLHESARAGHMIITKLLMKNGADLGKLNRDGKTVLYVALKNGRTQLADLLIKQFAAELDATRTLFDIVKDNVTDRDVYRFLVQKGASINSHDEAGDTPLIIAIQNQQRLAAKYLIANNADVNFAHTNGRLPLDFARQINNQDLINLLVENGARESANL